MAKQDLFKNNLYQYPWLLGILGFFLLISVSWLSEIMDLPYLLLNAPKTPVNWKEAIIESSLTAIIGILVVLRLRYNFNKRTEVESKLFESQRELQIEKEKLEEVLNIGCEISSILRLNQLIDFIIDQAVKLLDVERCSLMMIDMQKNELVIKGSFGVKADVIRDTRLALGERIAGKVASQGLPLLVRDIRSSEFAALAPLHSYKSHSFMSVPILLHREVVGVISVTEKRLTESTDAAFREMDLKILTRIVHQAAISIENATYYQELEYLTQIDSLTGLYNHRYFVQAIDKEIERAKRYNRTLSLLMLDVDNFKYFNDTYGHPAGDALLKEISMLMLKVTRDIDICCRYAGDEFIIILPETDIQQARIFGEKLTTAIKAIQFNEESVSASAGVAEYENFKHNRMDFVRKVDQALYDSKKARKKKSKKRS